MSERVTRSGQNPSGTCFGDNRRVLSDASGSSRTSERPDSDPHVSAAKERAARKPLHVLYIVDSFDIGGTESQVVQMSRQLSQLGIPVTVCCLKAEGPLLESVRRANIEVVEFRPGNTLYAMHSLRQILRLAHFIRKRKFDVVHTHGLWSNLMGVPAAWIARATVIISSQRDLAHLSWYTPFRRRVIALVHRLAHRVVVNSSAVREMLLSEMKILPHHVCIIRNGVDIERYARMGDQRRLLFPEISAERQLVAVVANMNSPLKGHSHLLDAAHRVREIVPEVMFVLIGDGPLRPSLEWAVSERGLQDHFLFLGRRSDTPALLCCCNLFVLPSLAEGLPNALLEAMAVGLPVVATRIGGIPEVVEDGINGVLVEAKSANAIADAVIRMIQCPEFAHRLALSAQERIRTGFTFDRVINELMDLYASVAAQPGWKVAACRAYDARSTY